MELECAEAADLPKGWRADETLHAANLRESQRKSDSNEQQPECERQNEHKHFPCAGWLTGWLFHFHFVYTPQNINKIYGSSNWWVGET